MLRYLACAAAAFLLSTPAQAALQTYDWTFTGGFLQLEYGYPINARLQGNFTVDDVNADGKFDKSELQSFSYLGYDFSKCAGCTIENFSWVPGSAPQFKMNRQIYTPDYESSDSITTGQSYGSSYTSYRNGEPHYSGGRWSPDVTWAVSAVPEPQTWLMLGAGLLAVGAAARRRKPA